MSDIYLIQLWSHRWLEVVVFFYFFDCPGYKVQVRWLHFKKTLWASSAQTLGSPKQPISLGSLLITLLFVGIH